MLSTKKILLVGVGIASMAGVMAMSTAPVAAADGTVASWPIFLDRVLKSKRTEREKSWGQTEMVR